MAQLVLATAGAVVGGLFGMPQLGWAIGSLLGAAIAGGQTQKSQGPRLGDLKVTGTEYGQAIPYMRSHTRTAGQLIWASTRREIATTTTQGKGGPSAETTTYTYEVDVLYLLSDNEIAGVSRIWNNGKLVYTALAASTVASVAASNATEQWTRVTVYGGAASQLPDPTYEAAVGAANAPAYRGRGTLFIEGLQLGSSGQIPNLTFEVCVTATQTGQVAASNLWRNMPATDGFGVPGFSESQYILPVILSGDLNYYAVDGDTATLSSTYAPPNGNFIQGVSDESCVCTYYSGTPLVVTITWGENASSSSFTNGTSGFNSPNNFAKRGDVVVMNNTTTGKLRRFTRAGGAAGAVTGGTYSIYSFAIGTSQVYALDDTWVSVYVFTTTTMALAATLSAPEPGMSGVVMTNDAGDLFCQKGYNLYKWDGSAWYLFSAMASTLGDNHGIGPRNSIVGNVLYTVQPDTGANLWKLTKGDIAIVLAPLNESVASVVSLLCLRAGLSAGQFDVTALSSITRQVRSLAISQVGNTRAVLELLATAYFFEMVLSDKLYFRPRGAASVATIPYADLGASSNPEGAAEPFALRPLNDLEIPAVVTVNYIDVDADYERGAQSSDRLRSTSKTTSSVDIALGLTASEAKGIADTMVLDQIASALTTKIALLDTYAALEPTDPVVATAEDGSTFRLRLVKLNAAAGVREFDAVIDDASVLTSAGITMPAATSSIVVAAPADTVLNLLDIPILRDADDDPGFYASAKGSTSPYAGAALYRSPDDVNYAQIATITESAVSGTASTTLGDFAPGDAVIDEVNSLTVNVGAGQLAGTTRTTLFTDVSVNALLVGSEIIRFLNAALVSTGVYTLTGLLRGQRGTGWAIAGHAASERVVLLKTTGLRRLSEEASAIGVPTYYKGVTIGRRLSTATAQAFADTGIGLKPFSPVDLRVARSTAGDVTLSWKRRTRLSTSASSVPLGESSESYSIDIYSDSSFTTVLRTLTSTTQSVVYTQAQQATDFGSLPSSISCKVYQVSDEVGRGYPLQSTVSTDNGVAVFVPDTLNPRPIVLLSAGDQWLASREGTSGGSRSLGLYTYSHPDTEALLLGFTGASATTPYLLGLALTASNPSTGAFVLYLRAQTNPSGFRKMFYGVLPGSCLQVTPSFMTATPPIGIWWTGSEFRALLSDGHVWSSTTGATWADQGASSGGPSSTAGNLSGAYIVVVGTKLAMKFENSVYTCSSTDGITWTAATGDVASLPTATYSDYFALVGIASTGSRAVLIAYGKKPSDGTTYGLVYTSTDGAAWTKVEETNYYGPSVFSRSSQFNGAVTTFNGDFLCDLWPAVPGSAQADIATLHDFGGGVLLEYAYKAELAGIGGSSAVLAAGLGTTGFALDTLYSTTDLAAFSGLIWTE
jgi:hypothetical protein